MESKLSVFGCLTCGEYFKGPILESITHFEMHMCCDETLVGKWQKLLELRKIIDGEIEKITPTPSGESLQILQPLSMPIPKPPPPSMLISPFSSGMSQGEVK